MSEDKIEVYGADLPCKEDPKDTFKAIEGFKEGNKAFIQLFDHNLVIGKEHLIWAYNKALECFREGSNRADSIEIETLLWASGERQIKDAITKMGVKKRNNQVVILTNTNIDKFLRYMDWNREDSVVKPSIKKLKNLGISEEEINSTNNPYDLIFERMSTSIL